MLRLQVFQRCQQNLHSCSIKEVMMLESGLCWLLNCPQKCWGSLGSPPAGVQGSLPPEGRKGELSRSPSKKNCISLLKKWPQNVIFLSFQQVYAHFCTALYFTRCYLESRREAYQTGPPAGQSPSARTFSTAKCSDYEETSLGFSDLIRGHYGRLRDWRRRPSCVSLRFEARALRVRVEEALNESQSVTDTYALYWSLETSVLLIIWTRITELKSVLNALSHLWRIYLLLSRQRNSRPWLTHSVFYSLVSKSPIAEIC